MIKNKTRKKDEYYIQWIGFLKSIFLSALGALAFVVFYCYQHDVIDKYLILMGSVLFITLTTLYAVIRNYISKLGINEEEINDD
jgi:hypothetical protein